MANLRNGVVDKAVDTSKEYLLLLIWLSIPQRTPYYDHLLLLLRRH
jgi:hypothetical protein